MLEIYIVIVVPAKETLQLLLECLQQFFCHNLPCLEYHNLKNNIGNYSLMFPQKNQIYLQQLPTSFPGDTVI